MLDAGHRGELVRQPPRERRHRHCRRVLPRRHHDGEGQLAVGVEAGIDGGQAHEAVQGEAGADEQDDGQGDFRDDERDAEPLPRASRAGAAAAGAQRIGRIGRRALHRRREAEDQRRHEREQERRQEDAAVERRVGEPRNVGRPERDQRRRAPAGERERARRADRIEHRRLRQELPHEPPAPRAERLADRDLAVARGRARQQQVGDVRARDEHDEADGAEEDVERRLHVAHRVVLQRRHAGAHVLVGVGILRRERAGDAADLGVRLLHGVTDGFSRPTTRR